MVAHSLTVSFLSRYGGIYARHREIDKKLHRAISREKPHIYRSFDQWQPPLQFLQSQPHCRDFPRLLSRTILLTASMTPITTTVSTIAVPIPHSPFHEISKTPFAPAETADTEEQLTTPPPQRFQSQKLL